ncbi:MAG: UDP-N-acetylglucosamine 1-carboxyvinyltransferase [Candidatus Marinimicrobia bacterium]|nr:UDP-N-acetylglucosamine 1-carboxyvinyltransferase [Candidatus Neomarinimicrobiota bacterium]
MEKLVIEGNHQLKGEVQISGAKNAVLPVMAAALLAAGETKINRVPDLRDTRTMAKLLEIIGVQIQFADGKMLIDATSIDKPIAPYDLVNKMRASFYVLGPLVARFGKAIVSLPGGCAWGPRPVDYHLKGLEKLGAKIELEGGDIIAKSKKLVGNKIRFDFPSVGATGNIIMAATLAKGETKIENAAKEPEIVQLCEFLISMGAKIDGVGTTVIIVEGVDELLPQEVSVIPDRIEAGTFLIAGAALGKITLKNTIPEHLSVVIEKLIEVGAEIVIDKNDITVKRAKKINAIDVTTAVFPGFATDLQAQWIALMSIATGSSIVTDTIYNDRFSHVPELSRLGANITVEGNSAIVRGVKELIGAKVRSTDIRASASLILAGLMAKGVTEVNHIHHIDRGYEKIENKFAQLGAKIRRISIDD